MKAGLDRAWQPSGKLLSRHDEHRVLSPDGYALGAHAPSQTNQLVELSLGVLELPRPWATLLNRPNLLIAPS